jgi:hypothetical protein
LGDTLAANAEIIRAFAANTTAALLIIGPEIT